VAPRSTRRVGCREYHNDLDGATELAEEGSGLGYHVTIVVGDDVYAPGGEGGGLLSMSRRNFTWVTQAEIGCLDDSRSYNR
jgi:hypothetical protein